jgi:hypothetical protein
VGAEERGRHPVSTWVSSTVAGPVLEVSMLDEFFRERSFCDSCVFFDTKTCKHGASAYCFEKDIVFVSLADLVAQTLTGKEQ